MNVSSFHIRIFWFGDDIYLDSYAFYELRIYQFSIDCIQVEKQTVSQHTHALLSCKNEWDVVVEVHYVLSYLLQLCNKTCVFDEPTKKCDISHNACSMICFKAQENGH